MDSDLSGKWRYPGFEQPGPGWELATPPPQKKKLNKYTWAIICLDILRFVIHRHLFMIQ